MKVDYISSYFVLFFVRQSKFHFLYISSDVTDELIIPLQLTLSALGYFCLIMPPGGQIVSPFAKILIGNAFDMKFGTVILYTITKKC